MLRTMSGGRRLEALLLLLALLLGGRLRLRHMDDVRLRTTDETVYAGYTTAVATSGMSALPGLHAAFLTRADFELPPPTRFGLPLTARLLTPFIADPFRALAWISCGASIATLALVGLIGWQFLDPWTSVLGVFLLSVFGPDLSVARRGWTDALIACLSCAMLYATLRFTRRAEPGALATVAGLAAVLPLVKEGAIVVTAACGAWMLVTRRAMVARIVAAFLVAGAAAIGALALAAGGAGPLLSVENGLRTGHLANWYVHVYQTGPVWWMIRALVLVSPATTLLAAVGLVAVAWNARRAWNSAATALALFAVYDVIVLPWLMPGWINLRIASPAFGPICLMAAIGAIGLVRALQSTCARALSAPIAVASAAALLAAGAADYDRSRTVFVDLDVADPSPRGIFDKVDADHLRHGPFRHSLSPPGLP